MKSSKQIELDFWRKKIEEYCETIEENCITKTNPQMPTNWSLNKKLSNKITISVTNKQCEGDETFLFVLHCGKQSKYSYFGSYNTVANLFNKFYENFEKDNAIFQRKVKPIIQNEIKMKINTKAIKDFIDAMMLDSEYEWKVVEKENCSVLRIKLKSARIIEFLIYHNTFQRHPEFFNPNELLNSVVTIDKGLEKNHLPVQILNCINEKW